MGLQKYRADEAGEKQTNGATPYYARWMGGPTLALIRDCPVRGQIDGKEIPPRTVYVRGEPDTFFSTPAACQYKRKIIYGYIGCEDGEYYFQAIKRAAAV